MKQLWGKDLELYLVADVNDRVYAIRKIGNAALLDVKVHQTLSRLAQKFSSFGSMEEKEKKVLEFLQSLESELIKELRELIIGEAAARKSAWEGGILYLAA
jgi:effector-binding domain-containing protein